MKLICINKPSVFKIFVEGYGRTSKFDYTGFKADPSPEILKLGTYVHPNTGNTNVAGINLHYLTPNLLNDLRKQIGIILKNKDLRERVGVIERHMPEIIKGGSGVINTAKPGKGAYRTYNLDKMSKEELGTLKFMSVEE